MPYTALRNASLVQFMVLKAETFAERITAGKFLFKRLPNQANASVNDSKRAKLLLHLHEVFVMIFPFVEKPGSLCQHFACRGTALRLSHSMTTDRTWNSTIEAFETVWDLCLAVCHCCVCIIHCPCISGHIPPRADNPSCTRTIFLPSYRHLAR